MGVNLTWFGNKRTRLVNVSEQKWMGFDTNLTLDNYKIRLSGKEIHLQGCQRQ